MKTFSLMIQDATHAEKIEGVSSFVGKDAALIVEIQETKPDPDSAIRRQPFAYEAELDADYRRDEIGAEIIVVHIRTAADRHTDL